jgi:uncharacterized membrane protein YbaN (DUF454 family)
MRWAYQLFGLLALGAAGVGVVMPLLPTVPFLLLAAFCFARSNPEWERRIVEHPRFGGAIRDWRERRAIGAKAKAAAAVALGASAMGGLILLDYPWSLAPIVAASVAGAWIMSRPS